MGVADLWQLVADPFSDIAIDFGSGSELSQRTRLGRRIGQLQDRHIAGYRVVRAGTRQGAQLWRLEPVADGDPGGDAL